MDKLSSGKAFLSQGHHGSGAAKPSSNAASTGTGAAGAGETAGGVKRLAKDKESRPAMVDGVPFKVVWSAMLLTEVIQTYLEVALNFAPVTTDVINKIVEMLRLFDSRSRQLVLGAQAIQSAARLKSISVKHLALTGQSLGLLIALLPHIRAALLAQFPPKHQLLLTELDRVSHDLHEHHAQIVAKFVAIVSDHVDGLAASALKVVDWDHFQGLKCEYFEEIQKAVVNIHRVLQTTLPQTQVQDVFSRIFALLNRKIPAHFEEINPVTQTGRQRILDEITHLVTAFSRIKQIDATALTDSLEETFRKRYARDR
jgi:vacuolar protein sorting-associated protein 54